MTGGSGKHPFAGGVAYCASKAGLNALTESLMQDVRGDRIRVSCVLPGSVNTEFGGGRPAADADWKLDVSDSRTGPWSTCCATRLAAFPAGSSCARPSREESEATRPPWASSGGSGSRRRVSGDRSPRFTAAACVRPAQARARPATLRGYGDGPPALQASGGGRLARPLLQPGSTLVRNRPALFSSSILALASARSA